jgi:predicted XRE-type DNA-binding protein
MSKERFTSVWDAIEDTPRAAASMKVRSKLMIKLQETLGRQKLTQVQVAKLLGVTQPRVSDLMRGKGVIRVGHELTRAPSRNETISVLVRRKGNTAFRKRTQ